MTINIFVLKGDLNGETRNGVFLFCWVYMQLSQIVSPYSSKDLIKVVYMDSSDLRSNLHLNLLIMLIQAQK